MKLIRFHSSNALLYFVFLFSSLFILKCVLKHFTSGNSIMPPKRKQAGGKKAQSQPAKAEKQNGSSNGNGVDIDGRF